MGDSSMLEVLNRTLMLLCRLASWKSTEIFSFTSLLTYLTAINPKLAGFEFADHGAIGC